ncbi:hypothetical protein LCGC14_2351400 [marine sediment metagenome]|uniref:Uncharacterized protein n=1 Tax=marine sediment metagenome TaxID=412755 RepID=A0A0F9F464_9ZZZZ
MEEIIVEGWKGKGETRISQSLNDFRIIEVRKEKETGEIKESIHFVGKEIVNKVWEMFLDKCDLEKEYKYRFLIRKWIELNKINEKYNLTIEQMIECFNGGKYRKLEYFPFYYSLKILEVKQKIIYYGRGGCKRISQY